MRLYVPAAVSHLRRLEGEGTLPAQDAPVAMAVTPWVLAELGIDDAEDEEAEYSVLVAAAETQLAGGAPAAVLAFELPVAELASDGIVVRLDRDLPRRRLAAIHLLPDLRWYAGHELPDVVAALT